MTRTPHSRDYPKRHHGAVIFSDSFGPSMERRMTPRTAAACVFVGLTSCAAALGAPRQALPRIATPETLAIEMAKALVSADRERFTALVATREEMEALLETHQPPATPQDRRELKDRVAEILAVRAEEFDRFQAMKKAAGFTEGVAVRFELIALAPLYVKDGMKKIRNSRIRMFQPTGGKEEAFLIRLDDMFLFPRGWAFTSVAPGIGKEPLK